MDHTRLYDIRSRLCGRRLRSVLRWAAGFGPLGSFVFPFGSKAYGPRSEEFIHGLTDVSEHFALQWPGSSSDRPVRAVVFNFPASCEYILRHVPCLTKLVLPHYPESLAVYREDGEPFFGSETIDPHFWIEITDDELIEFRRCAPDVKLRIPGRYFCEPHGEDIIPTFIRERWRTSGKVT